MSARPIFVIGRHRSGTTWLSNVIASHPAVYAPQHPLHNGVHESAFFSRLVPYCNGGRTAADLLAIKQLFEASDYFLLTGLEQGPDIVANGYVQYFRLVMEAAAARHAARYWLEKTPTHTLRAGFLAESYPDAILLAVIRNVTDVVASNVHGFGKPGSVWAWFRQAVVTAVYEKIIRRSNALIIRYEDLRDGYDATIRSIAARLGLDGEIPRNVFARNSSYDGESPRTRWWQGIAVQCGRLVVCLCPGALIEAAVRRWQATSAVTLPPWFFLVRSADNPPG